MSKKGLALVGYVLKQFTVELFHHVEHAGYIYVEGKKGQLFAKRRRENKKQKENQPSGDIRGLAAAEIRRIHTERSVQQEHCFVFCARAVVSQVLPLSTGSLLAKK